MTSERLPETPLTFRAVYDGYFDFVWRFAALDGVPSAALEVVVRHVFVVVHRHLGGFDGSVALKIEIARVTRNVVRSYLSTQFRLLSGELPTAELSGSGELGPPELLEQKSASQLLDVILGRMTERQREAFILCEIEGLSALETAEALSVSEATLQLRLREARKVFQAVSAHVRAQRFWLTRERGNQS